MKLGSTLLGVGAVGVALGGGFASPSPPGPRMPLARPAKIAAGPPLGFVFGSGGMTLTPIDPRTLRPRRARELALSWIDAWALGSGGSQLALAVHPHPVNEANAVKIVSLPGLRLRAGAVRVGGDVSALAWVAPRRLVALVGRALCCPGRFSVALLNPFARAVISRRRLPGTILRIARFPKGLVLLAAPSDTIGAAMLIVLDRRGVRQLPLPAIAAGQVSGGAGISEQRVPGLTVDSAGRVAYVVDPANLVAAVDLSSLTASYHRPTSAVSALGRLSAWLQPSAEAKGDEGPVRRAQWLGRGLLLVSGSNVRGTATAVESDPAGVELIDTRRWTARTLDPDSDSFAVADGLLLASGSRWHAEAGPTGTGLAVYGPNGARRLTLFPGRVVGVDRISAGRAYIGVDGRNLDRVVDLRTGRVVGTRALETVAEPLLGEGDVADW